jgi:GNAT superfamily N-acetyltransferase
LLFLKVLISGFNIMSIIRIRFYQIAGMALNGILKKGEREEAERRLEEMKDEKFKTIFRVLYKVNEKIDLFAKYDVDELFECRILSVDADYRGKGLASILMADSEKIARNAGFKVN